MCLVGYEVLDNRPMLHLCREMGFDIEEKGNEGVYELKMMFRKNDLLPFH
jgi:hypothetical protein